MKYTVQSNNTSNIMYIVPDENGRGALEAIEALEYALKCDKHVMYAVLQDPPSHKEEITTQDLVGHMVCFSWAYTREELEDVLKYMKLTGKNWLRCYLEPKYMKERLTDD